MRLLQKLSRFALVGALVASASLALAGPAAAHNQLVSSDPADGATLSTGPSTVTLVFDQTVGSLGSEVTVSGPGNSRWEGDDLQIVNNTVVQSVNPLGPSGIYTIAYRITSADGHPVSATLQFTLTSTGTGTPNPPVTGADEGVPGWLWIGGAGLLIALLATTGIIAASRRPGTASE